jgi:hypothetical protein
MAYTKEIGLRDLYIKYKERCENKGWTCYDYKVFSTIIKEANLMLRDAIIYNADTITLPFRSGKLSVRKFAVPYRLDNKKNWAVNWKATKEAGKRVFHGEEFGYRWKWNKFDCHVTGKKYYIFRPCRKASRMIKDAVKNKKLDFYS